MNRLLFPLIIASINILLISAQKEIYFSTPKPKNDSVSISSLKGIYCGFNNNFGHTGYYTTLNFGYLQELKLNSKFSLILDGSVNNSIYKIYENLNDFYNYDLKYGLQLSVSSDFRWYFSYKNKKSDDLNSGWYVSIPFVISSSILNSKYELGANISFAPAIGFRNAFSDKLFVEADLGLGGTYYYFSFIQTLPYFRFKTCYTF